MITSVSALELKQRLTEDGELALLDVREQGVFAARHLLLASCVPLSHLEMMMGALVPRLSTPLVLCDDGPEGGEALARGAAERLSAMGYTDVSVLAGGIRGWERCGFELFSGVNVPSKAFGEFIEQRSATPHITAAALHERLLGEAAPLIVDSRPFPEYQRMSIPGGIDVPGAELVYRIHQLAPDAATDIVVNCAGRTRSIIGAQSLINAGIPNRVVALENGTMGWQLAGFDLEHGQSRRAAAPAPGAAHHAEEAASRVAARFGVRGVDLETLARWRADRERTLYLFDVRTPEEFDRGHLPGSRHAPGGQLIQATDEYAPVRNARVVLVDDARVRALMTASWLLQMGWRDVHVLDHPLTELELETGPGPEAEHCAGGVQSIDALELRAALDSREAIAVVDLATSLEYRERHIPQAWWAVRARLQEALRLIPPVGLLVTTATQPELARLAAADLASLRENVNVRMLAGGNRSWFDAGLPTSTGMERATTTTDDVWYKPYEQRSAVAERMQEYLDWEVALVEQVERDGTLRFPCFD
ncbi:MAG: thiosulfate sulfurtransferase [Gammaproteobacteria bacterium]|nr:thiosulfate sulfurtransferase [Gammaproteobacteria bacterium]